MKLAMASFALAALTMAPVAAQAASFSTPTSARAFISANGTGATNSAADYSTGFFGTPTEFRSFFQFNLPTFTGKISSARLRLNTGALAASAFPINYQISSLADSSVFSAVGTGTV